MGLLDVEIDCICLLGMPPIDGRGLYGQLELSKSEFSLNVKRRKFATVYHVLYGAKVEGTDHVDETGRESFGLGLNSFVQSHGELSEPANQLRITTP